MNKKIIFKKNQASKFAYFSLMFVAGTSIEQVNELGFSHLIEHLLIRAGNEQSLNELFDMNGAAIKGETSRDYINLSGYCLAEDFNKIFKILISRIFNLSITEDELLREKKIVLIELNQYENSKKSINDNREILWNLVRKLDIRVALTSVLFALVHHPGTILAWCLYVSLGIFLGMVRYKSDLWGSMGLHLVWNLLVYSLLLFI